MYSPKVRTGPLRATRRPMLTITRRRGHLYPFFFRMGPVTLCIASVLLMGLMAVFYLSQLGQAVAANQRLQSIHSEQSTLLRQNQDLIDTVAQEQSPAYIAANASKQGLAPVDPKNVWVVSAQNLHPIPTHGLNTSGSSSP